MIKSNHGTRKTTLLINVPLGVVTLTAPVVAPAGTVVVIWVGDTTVKVALTPWKLAAVAPVRFVPRIVTSVPTLPEVGTVWTNGPSSTEPLRGVRKARASLGLKLLHDKQVSRVMSEPATAFSVCGGRVSIGTAANGKAMLVVNVRATGPKALKRIPEKYCGFPVKVVRR